MLGVLSVLVVSTGCPPPPPPACGDGIVDAHEQCDDEEESPLCDADCTDVVCGDSIVNAAAGEQCDHEAIADPSCTSLGFDEGMLSCSADCTFDTSSCVTWMCGDGVQHGAEECDGEDLGAATCMKYGFPGGLLTCNDDCTLDTSRCDRWIDPPVPPQAPVLELGFWQVKQFEFGWTAVEGAEHYELFESPAPEEPFARLGDDIVGESISLTMPLHLRHEASYVLRACNVAGCTDSAPVSVAGSLAEAIGYFKASNTGTYDLFGASVALSDDGSTLAVGAYYEASSATGINGDQDDDSVFGAGAVYVFVRDPMGQWSQQAYVKAAHTDMDDFFGWSVALSGDGDTLAVGAPYEDSSATGIDGPYDQSAVWAGAVYVFRRNASDQWSQQAYVKASNTGQGDAFGRSVALSGDGDTLAVGAPEESSSATGIDEPYDDDAVAAGAVYVFVRNETEWSQQAYIKASNTDAYDRFGHGIALSGDGSTLAVAAPDESSSATGIDGNQYSDFAASAGAVYLFVRDAASEWSQRAYVKASNTDAYDRFGESVALDGDARTLAVGAIGEASGARGVDGEAVDDSAGGAGAVYVFARDAASEWSQQAYVKASNTDAEDQFGGRVRVSDDGSVLAVGASQEASNATGIGGSQANNSSPRAGAIYVLVRDAMGQWSQRAYVKASNTQAGDELGRGVALSGDGHTLAAGAYFESSSATGIGGDPMDEGATWSGAVYLY